MKLYEVRALNIDLIDQSMDELKKFSGRPTLRIQIDATRSGTIVNNRVYPGVAMRNSVSSWTVPYNKPLLPKHPGGGFFAPPEEIPPIGRISNAVFEKFVDEEELSRDWKTPSVRSKGSGRILVDGDVSDEDAINMFLDGRYKTVSVGMRSQNMFCSVCGHDWMQQDGACEHIPGRVYEVEDKKVVAYHITGVLDYDHLATVNTPAMPYAGVIAGDFIDQETIDQFNISNHIDEAEVTSFLLFDKERKIELAVNNPFRKRTNAAAMSSVRTQVPVPVAIVGDLAGAAQGFGVAKADGSMSGGKFMKDKLPDGKPGKGKSDDGVPSEDHVFLSSELLDMAEELKLYEDGAIQDKPLTAAERNKLPDSAFCGPNRTFPAHDAPRVRNGLARLPQAKNFSSAEKKRILACLKRRAKKFGIEVGDNDEDYLGQDPKDGDLDMTRKTVEALTNANAQLDSRILDLQVQLDEKNDELESVMSDNQKLVKELHKSLASRLVDLKILLGKPDVKEAKDKESTDKIVDEFASRDKKSLEDSIADLLNEFKSKGIDAGIGGVDDPTMRAANLNKGDNRPKSKREKLASIYGKNSGGSA